MTFRTDMLRIAARINSDLDELGRAVKFDAFSGVIDDTRVKSGRAKGSWEASEDFPASGIREQPDKEGPRTIADMDSKISGIGVTFFTSNLPYMRKLEELDGMVQKNVVRVKRTVREQARRRRF